MEDNTTQTDQNGALGNLKSLFGDSTPIGAITSAITSVVQTVSGTIQNTLLGSQDAITQRRAIIASSLKDMMSMDTNKNNNIGFLIIGGLVLGGLLYIAAKKKTK